MKLVKIRIWIEQWYLPIAVLIFCVGMVFRYRMERDFFLAVGVCGILALFVAWRLQAAVNKHSMFLAISIGFFVSALLSPLIRDRDRDGLNDAWDPFPKHNFPQDKDNDGTPDLIDRKLSSALTYNRTRPFAQPMQTYRDYFLAGIGRSPTLHLVRVGANSRHPKNFLIGRFVP